MSTINSIMNKITDAMQEKVSIQIGSYSGQIVYYNLMISQGLLGHHTFSFTWRIGDVVMDFKNQADFIKQYMGAKVIVTLKDSAKGQNVYFKGIITQMEVLNNDGASKGFQIVGESPTVLLDEIKQSETYFSRPIEEIVKKIDNSMPKGILTGMNVRTRFAKNCDYIVQYNETDFQFLQRLATQYGEWMYYDGDYLQFGEIKTTKAVLNNGVNLHNFKITSRLRPQKVSYKGYDYNYASEIGAKNLEPQNNTQSYIAQNAQQASSNVYDRNNVNHAFVSNAHDAQDITRVQELIQQGKEANVLTYSGLSTIPLQIGGTVTIAKDTIESDFIATGVHHYSKGFGHYECQFDAIPRDVKVPPYTNPLAYPKAETQSAIVTDNNDPSGMGRVRVKFFWGYESDWTRLVTPHAGSGKGFYFIPEIGEEVFVSFEGGNPEKPFIIGTQYNGQEISGYNTSGNDQKVIHTRSGTKMIFNDAQGSIFIEDPSGNTWLMDGQGNINVNAPNDMNITVGKNLNINVGSNMTTSVGVNMTETVGVDKATTVGMMANTFVGGNSMLNVTGNLTEFIQGNLESHSVQNVILNGNKEVMISSAAEITKHSQKEIIHNSSNPNTLY
ncbi:type VI secretion system Vgr family protein [Flavobacterium sp. H122]|uniref:type VI secretion system Vgr family protein n=1 Tax=Flavobacterium sp. H122 TaxID=2529860 RepID=UPI0010AAF299|nr:type VI secretion system Vgr family protein [Flavobacterium sp. H122]